jgi:hypothetical protein
VHPESHTRPENTPAGILDGVARGPRRALVDADIFDAVVKGVTLGSYHLVLGAGASAGCRNSAGLLPLGGSLMKRFLDDIGLDASPDVTLAHAYDETVAQRGQTQVVALLRELYAGAEPLPWHRRIAELAWEAIWTFNIDDVIENAYRVATSPPQYISVRLWDERPQPLGGATGRVPIVHLHGYVGTIEPKPDPKLIFGLAEYLGALRSAPGNWHTRFSSEFLDKPVIIVGARLSDELDFGEVIRSGNTSRDYGYPSLIVVDKPTDLNRRQYERWGLTLVECQAERFFEYLVTEVRAKAGSLPTNRHTTRYTERTFQVLPKHREDDSPSVGHDFFGGHSPEWVDVLDELDAEPRFVREILERIGTPAAAPHDLHHIYLLVGAPFGGKSTALLRVGRELQELGWEPTYLTGLDRLEIDESLAYFRDRPNAVLLVEDIHYDINDLVVLLEHARAKGQRLLVFGTDRQQFHRRILLNTPIHLLPERKPNWFRPPTDSLWDRIVERRRDHARLGRLETSSRLVTQKHFVDNGKDLFSSLANLEDAAGFVTRGLDAVQNIDPAHKTAFAAVALTGWVGLPIPSSVVAGVAGLNIRELVDATRTEGPLAGWVTLGGGGLMRLRHRFLGDLIVGRSDELIPPSNLLVLAQRICLQLADRVSVEVMREKKLEYRIVAALMDETTLHEISPKAELDEWYAGLEEAYGWNARLWEQWALSLQDLDRAYSYAQRAVNRLSDSLTHNTLGTVVMRRSERALSVRTPGPWQAYWSEATEELVESRELGDGTFEYPYITFLSHSLRIFRKAAGRDPNWDAEVQRSARDWLGLVRRHKVLTDRRSQQLIASLPDQWRVASTRH